MNKRLLWASILVGLGNLLACGYFVNQAKDVRRSPFANKDKAKVILESNWPHAIPGRIMLFKAGTSSFSRDLNAWLAFEFSLDDTYVNRLILEKHILSLNDPELLRLWFASYPISPTSALLEVMERALSDEPRIMLKLLLRVNDKEGKESLRRYVSSKLSGASPETAAFLLPHLLLDPQAGIDWSSLLERNWVSFSAEHKKQFFQELSLAAPRDWAPPESFTQWMTGILTKETGLLADVSAGQVAAMSIGRSENWSTLTRLLRAAPSQAFSEGVCGRLAVRQLAAISAHAFPDLLSNNSVAAVAACSPTLAAQNDADINQNLDALIAKTPDNSARKALIVNLCNHSNPIGSKWVDEAFRGSAPRITEFRAVRYYAYGSKAGDRYQQLSGSRYIDKGKLWPPPSGSKDVDAWRAFVFENPWFPGADDARYRLAFLLQERGDFGGVGQVFSEWASVREQTLDRDADRYIAATLRTALLQSKVELVNVELQRNLVVLLKHPPIIDLLERKTVPSETIESFKWFVANPSYLFAISSSDTALKNAIAQFEAVQLGSTSPLKAAALLAGSEDTLELLYGWGYAVMNAYDGDPAIDAAHTVSKIIVERWDESVEDMASWLQMLLAHHRKPWQELISTRPAHFLEQALQPAAQALVLRISRDMSGANPSLKELVEWGSAK